MIWRSILFLLILSFFFWGNGWYEPSQLAISGQSDGGNPTLRVRWDSGEGFNEYEQRIFHSSVQPLDKQFSSTLVFGGKGERNSASLSSDVVCTAIVVDGRTLDLNDLKQDIPFSNGELLFSEGKTLSLPVQSQSHIGVRFRTNNHSGIAVLSVNGVQAEHDLYMPNVEAKEKQFDSWMLLPDGSFRVTMEMPRYAIGELEILSTDSTHSVQLTAVTLQTKEQNIDLLRGGKPPRGDVHFFNLLEPLRTYYHPFQLCLQICFALMTTWLISSLVQLYRNTGGLRSCLLEEKRYVFCLLFFSSLTVFTLWLAAFWPGVMSVDSLKVWRAAMLPDMYLNDHPVLNVIIYKYLYQIWSNPAVVPVVQVILMSLLVSWFVFWLYREGVPTVVLLPCFLLIVCSVAVGVYTIVLWKDIPFALLIVFWACLLVKFYRQRVYGKLHWSAQKIAVLMLLGVSLGLVRHNGLVYLLVLPGMFILLRLVSAKTILIVILLCVLSGGIGYNIVKRMHGIPGTEFISQQIKHYAGGVTIKKVAQNSGRTIQDYMTVLNINQTEQGWDKFHYYFNDRYAYWFLLHSGWWNMYPYKKVTIPFPWLREKAMRVYEKSYQAPWVWFSWNPIWLLVLLPCVTLLFWWFPCSAIMGTVLLAGALPLVYLRIFNWRYYYFLYLGLLFMLPLVAFDISKKKNTDLR